MACRKAYRAKMANEKKEEGQVSVPIPVVEKKAERLLFGVDSKVNADDVLQNNINHFEWICRNKIYPNFIGRNINGEYKLTREEIDFLHKKGCKIAAIYHANDPKRTEEQGEILAKKVKIAAFELPIPDKMAIFLEIDDSEDATAEFMCGFAKSILKIGFTPAFKANTDANFGFDREFSRGMQSHKDIFEKCIIWATTPTVKEYDGMTTSHLIHPDRWMPYAPSAITRAEVAIWQYGKNCHPIEDDVGKKVTFNLDLVKNEGVIIDKMF
jgi:hypothetical protein